MHDRQAVYIGKFTPTRSGAAAFTG